MRLTDRSPFGVSSTNGHLLSWSLLGRREADQDARRVAGDLSSPAADATLDGRWRDAHHRKRELQAAVGSMSEAALRALRHWPWPSMTRARVL